MTDRQSHFIKLTDRQSYFEKLTDRQSIFEICVGVGHDAAMASAQRRTAAMTSDPPQLPAGVPKAAKPRKARAQLRHEALLAAAARIFIERGIVATSVDEIVV